MSMPLDGDTARVRSAKARAFALRGPLGKRCDGNIEYLLWRARDIDRLLLPFEHRDRWRRRKDWDGEYVGKWLDAAVRTLAFAENRELLARTDEVAARLRATQEPDGYLGNELPAHRLRTAWPLWAHWLAMKALREYGARRADPAAVEAAVRAGDWIVRQFHPIADEQNALYKIPHAVLVFLDEMAALYAMTDEARFLEFGAAAAEHYPPFRQMREERKAPPMHAYTLACYLDGAVQVARARGDDETLGWLTAIWEDIAAHHLFPTGSLSTKEHLNDPPADVPDGDLQETCATVEWLIFTDRLYRGCGDVRYANMLERTIRNALLGAQSTDGLKWTYFTPLRHTKNWLQGPTECCLFSGPRGIAMLPDLLYRLDAEGLRVDLFESSTATIDVYGHAVCLEQASDYPAGGHVTLRLRTTEPVSFAVKLRIPERTTDVRVNVNGQPVPGGAEPGTHVVLARTWRDGDTVELSFAPQVWLARLHDESGVLMRGIEVLAANRGDNEPGAGAVRIPEAPVLENAAPAADGRPRYRAAFDRDGQPVSVVLTPYADAGNAAVGVTWLDACYRTAFPIVRSG
ncbi:MAG: glycoside hydrolase family 127 protein [Kiritimatiellae bacterium]|nr:glycoside hydrolase family 127 protein [Kiritimatiellia bacterium]